MPGAHQNRSITPLLNWTGERKYDEKLEFNRLNLGRKGKFNI